MAGKQLSVPEKCGIGGKFFPGNLGPSRFSQPCIDRKKVPVVGKKERRKEGWIEGRKKERK